MCKGGFEFRFAKPESAYRHIAGDIKERAEILEKSNAVSASKVQPNLQACSKNETSCHVICC